MTGVGAALLLVGRLLVDRAQAPPSSLEFGKRDFPVYVPKQAPERVVLLLADHPAEMASVAAPLQAAGDLVVVVDVPRYLADSAARSKGCTVADVDFEALGKVAQKQLGLRQYHPASLFGVGPIASALAYVVLAQSPPGTFTNGVSAAFCPRLAVARPLCRERGLVETATRVDPSTAGTPLEPARRLVMPWTVVSVGDCPEPSVAAFAAEIPTAQMSLEGAGAASADVRIAAALARVEDAAGHGSVTAADPAVRDLPLREMVSAPRPDVGPADLLAVMVSGDGGWTGFDRQLGRGFAEHGVPVVGIDSLRYFWTPRTPEETGHDLQRILDTYLPAWNKTRLLLVGYSQGADVVPFMIAGLSPQQRARVALVVMIGPDGSADFGLDLEGWTTQADSHPELAVQPAVERMRGVPALCVFGAQEKGSLCPKLDRSQVGMLRVPEAGHFFGQQEDLILTSILTAVGDPQAALAPKRQHPAHPHRRRAHPGSEDQHATP